MSYSTHEPLYVIIRELRGKLPELTEMLHDRIRVGTLRGTVEMNSSLFARYNRREIVEKGEEQ